MTSIERTRLPPRTLAFTLLAGLLLCTGVIYLPGLRSGLYMDDYSNLAGLARIGSEGYLQFLFGGLAGPTGRPLSFLTFALQYHDWPHNVATFKAINLLLHLAVGALMFMLCRVIARAQNWQGETSTYFCTAVTGFWLLHPMQISTVLYVVQRMTQLSAFFVLAGVLAWLHGRRRYETGVRGGFAWMTGAVLLGTAAATLSKENGILLAPLLLVLDRTVLRNLPAPPAYRHWRLCFLVLPTAAILLYLGRHVLLGQELFSARSYTMYQKVLAEAVALVSYFAKLILPRPSAFGLFNDDFPVARGLLDPPSTLVAVLLVMALLGTGLALRRRAPFVAAGLLWYFTGHLLESTVLNLQIYFEHRNYLPSLGVALLFGAAVVRIHEPMVRAGYAKVLIILPLGVLAWITLQNTLLWSQPLRVAEEAVRMHPESRWALTNLGSQYLATGRLTDAEDLYRAAATRFPGALYPVLREASLLACVRNEPVPEPVWDELQRRAQRGTGDGFFIWPELDLVLRIMQQGECVGIQPARLQRLLETLGANPDLHIERGQALQLATNLCLLRMDLLCAERNSRSALTVYRTPDRQVQYADILLALGRKREAAAAIDELRALLARRPLLGLAYKAQLQDLQARLDALRARRR